MYKASSTNSRSHLEFLDDSESCPYPWKSVQTLFNITICQLLLSSFSMCQDMRLEICWLCKPLIAGIKRADIGSITSMDANMSTKIKVQWKSLPTAFKGTLYRIKKGHQYRKNWENLSVTYTHEYAWLKKTTLHTWKGFSPVCTSWCLFNFELSTNACKMRQWHKRIYELFLQ